jgi:hypothetical protein
MFIFQTENDFVTGRVMVDGPPVGIVYWSAEGHLGTINVSFALHLTM